MSNCVYNINKGVNKPIEFKGLKAQYIWFLGGGLVCLLIVFAILYIAGIPVFACLAAIVSAGSFLFMYVYKLSRLYGQHGLMKKVARRKIPRCVTSRFLIELMKIQRND